MIKRCLSLRVSCDPRRLFSVTMQLKRRQMRIFCTWFESDRMKGESSNLLGGPIVLTNTCGMAARAARVTTRKFRQQQMKVLIHAHLFHLISRQTHKGRARDPPVKLATSVWSGMFA